jgi:phage terminase Nu1 subunit (DNA packaging protein)
MDSFPKNVSVIALAKLLSVDRRTVTRLTTGGVLRKSARGGYDVIESIAAHRAHCESVVAAKHGEGALGKARAEYMTEKARMARLTRERMEGAVIAADEAEARGVALVTATKNKFVGMPAKLAGQLAAETSPAKCQLILRAHVNENLEDLTKGRFVQKATS